MRLAYMAFLAHAATQDSIWIRDGQRLYAAPGTFSGIRQDWCAVWRPELERLVATTDPHSPDRFRANGVLVNMPEFGKAFGCKADSHGCGQSVQGLVMGGFAQWTSDRSA